MIQELDGVNVLVCAGDTAETILNRIARDCQIPFSKVIMNGEPVLQRDNILKDIIVDFEINKITESLPPLPRTEKKKKNWKAKTIWERVGR